MARPNNKKKNTLIVKIISAITSLGIIVALILNSTQLFDRFKCNTEGQKNVDTLSTSDTFKFPIKTPQVYGKEDVEGYLNERILLLIEEARRDKLISITNSRNKYLEAYDLLPDSQKNKQFINSIKNSIISKDFATQINYLDSFFVSLKY
jgi:hypothetical protein